MDRTAVKNRLIQKYCNKRWYAGLAGFGPARIRSLQSTGVWGACCPYSPHPCLVTWGISPSNLLPSQAGGNRINSILCSSRRCGQQVWNYIIKIRCDEGGNRTLSLLSLPPRSACVPWMTLAVKVKPPCPHGWDGCWFRKTMNLNYNSNESCVGHWGVEPLSFWKNCHTFVYCKFFCSSHTAREDLACPS